MENNSICTIGHLPDEIICEIFKKCDKTRRVDLSLASKQFHNAFVLGFPVETFLQLLIYWRKNCTIANHKKMSIFQELICAIHGKEIRDIWNEYCKQSTLLKTITMENLFVYIPDGILLLLPNVWQLLDRHRSTVINGDTHNKHDKRNKENRDDIKSILKTFYKNVLSEEFGRKILSLSLLALINDNKEKSALMLLLECPYPHRVSFLQQRKELLWWTVRKYGVFKNDESSHILKHVLRHSTKEQCEFHPSNHMTSLMMAIKFCNFDLANQILNKPGHGNPAYVHKKNNDDDTCTALKLAIDALTLTYGNERKQFLSLICRILSTPDHGNPDAVISNSTGQSTNALMMACQSQYIDQETALDILSKSRDSTLEVVFENGENAFIIGCRRGWSRFLRALLARPSCDPNLKSHLGDTGLMIALGNREFDDDLLLEMIDQMKDDTLNTTNSQGETALILACQKRKERVAEAILRRPGNGNVDAFIHSRGDSALTIAQKNSLHQIKELILKIYLRRMYPSLEKLI